MDDVAAGTGVDRRFCSRQSGQNVDLITGRATAIENEAADIGIIDLLETLVDAGAINQQAVARDVVGLVVESESRACPVTPFTETALRD